MILLATRLLGFTTFSWSEVNSDWTKKSLMEREFSYTEEALAQFIQLVETRRIKINSISDLSSAELSELSREIGVYDAKKSAELMKIDLINLSKIFLAGQVLFTL